MCGNHEENKWNAKKEITENVIFMHWKRQWGYWIPMLKQNPEMLEYVSLVSLELH